MSGPPGKAALRRQVRAAVEALAPSARLAASEAIVARLAGLVPAGFVMAYVPLPDEVDVSGLLDRLGKDDRLLLPRVDGAGICPHRVRSPLGQLGRGAFGIPEPAAEEAVLPPSAISAVVVPGRAFDRRGGRLGRGSGFYDRFLATAPRAIRIGVAFPAQVLDRVPTDLHDLPMDALVLPDEVVVTGARGWVPAHPELP